MTIKERCGLALRSAYLQPGWLQATCDALKNCANYFKLFFHEFRWGNPQVEGSNTSSAQLDITRRCSKMPCAGPSRSIKVLLSHGLD